MTLKRSKPTRCKKIVAVLTVTGGRHGSRRLPVTNGHKFKPWSLPDGTVYPRSEDGSRADSAIVEGISRFRSVGDRVTLAGLGRHQNPRRNRPCAEAIA
jgi:hypothetical protein